MENKFFEHFEMFTTEREEFAINKLRKTNSVYNDLRVRHADESKEYEEIISYLTQREFLEHFKDDIYSLNGKERTAIYLQGYKDCIYLLLFFGMLEVLT